MTSDSFAHAARRRRPALWLLVFVGVLLHSGLCAPGIHVGTLRATACSVGSMDILPLDAPYPAAAPHPAAGHAGDDRAGEPGRPCTPVPRPRHAPCGALTDRGGGQHRTSVPTTVVPRGLPPYAAGLPASPGMPSRGDASRPPARRSGAGLLIDLCASRT
jgi:hypothetical protein